jgi:hypothetical protein
MREFDRIGGEKLLHTDSEVPRNDVYLNPVPAAPSSCDGTISRRVILI